jgi:hypothetical protein
MHSKFENHQCGECGSTDLAQRAEWYSGQVPAGVEGHIACNGCGYWEKTLSVAPAEDALDTNNWVVLEAGRGKYDSPEAREKTIFFRDPEAANYARFGVE